MKSRYPFILFASSSAFLVLVAFSCRLFYFACLWPFRDQFTTTAAESYPVYSIWKVIHGYPIYEWPQKDWYSLSLYNWLFYSFYGLVCRLFGADNAQILSVGRALTLLLCGLGAVVTVWIARAVLRELNLKPSSLVLAVGVCLLWFGPGTMGGINYTIRPDVSALVLALCGLRFFLMSMRAGMTALVVSGVLFFLAWSCKQSMVWTFAGCFACLLLSLDWRRVLLFAACLLAPMAATFAAFGTVYRYNVLFAPSIDPLLFHNATFELHRALLYGCFVFGWILYWPVLIDWSSLRQCGWRNFSRLPLGTRQLILLMMTTVIATVMDGIMLAKVGSGGNIFYEATVLNGVMALISLHHLIHSESRWRPAWLLYGALLFFVSAIVSGRNLLHYKQGRMGLMPLISKETYDQKADFGRWVKTLPAPLFIRDELFSQPWYSNRGQYPAIMTDPIFYDRAKALGLLQGGGLPALVRKKYFAALLVTADDEMAATALESGYVPAAIPPGQTYFQSSTYAKKEGPLVLLVSPSSPLAHP